MPRVANPSDPRVQRTRQLLLDAFLSLVLERHNIYSISIQEVTERANVNRTTFYAHFEDKYALISEWLCEKFQRELAQQSPASSPIQRETLYQLILTVFTFLAHGHRDHNPADRELEPLFEIALQQQLYAYLLQWLNKTPNESSAEALEITAQALSWAILGPAMRWSYGNRILSAEDMATHVLAVVIAGLSPVVTVT